MAKELSSLRVSVFGSIGGFASSMKAAVAPVNSFAGSIASAGSKLLAFTGIGSAVAASLGAITSLGKGISLAASFEQTQVAMETMLGSADAAKAVLGDLKTFAASTPFEFPELADSTKKLLAFGVTQDKLIPSLRAIGDIAAGIGAPVNELAEIYGKAKTQGTLFAEDINQLTGRGIPIIQELAKQFGVAESEVKALVSSGQVNFGHLEKAFANLTGEGGKFSGMMAKQSLTLSGLWSTLQDNLGFTLMEISQVILDTFGVKDGIGALSNGMQSAGKVVVDFVKTAAPRIKAFGVTIFNGLTVAYGYVSSVVTSIYEFVTANLQGIATSTAAYLGSVWGVVKAVMGVVGEFVGATWGAIVRVWEWATGSVVDRTASTGTQVGNIFKGMASVGQWLQERMTLAFRTIEYSLIHWRDTVKLVGVTAAYNLVKFGNVATWVLGEVVPSVAVWFADNWRDIMLTVFDFTTVVFTNLGQNIVNIIKNIPALIKGEKTFGELWNPLTQGFETSIKELPRIAERQVGGLEAELGAKADALGKSWSDGLADHLAESQKEAKKIGTAVAEALTPAGKIAVDGIEVPPVDPVSLDATIANDNLTVTVNPELGQTAITMAGSAEAQRARTLAGVSRAFVPGAKASQPSAPAATLAQPTSPTASAKPSAGMQEVAGQIIERLLAEAKRQTDRLDQLVTNTTTLRDLEFQTV